MAGGASTHWTRRTWRRYLLKEGVDWLANDLRRRAGGGVPWRDASRAARAFLYYNEAFHHKTECFATRLELTHRAPLFRTGFADLFQKTKGTDNCLEEGLANAAALHDTYEMLKKKLPDSLRLLDYALAGYVNDSPPGYRRGTEVRKDMLAFRCRFAAENQGVCLPGLPQKHPDVWRTAPHLFDGISNIRGRVNYILPRSSPLMARTRLRPLLPPRKLVKKLRELAGLDFVRSGGAHDIYQAGNGREIQIPRHPRDLGPGLLRGILRQAGLDMSLHEFMGS